MTTRQPAVFIIYLFNCLRKILVIIAIDQFSVNRRARKSINNAFQVTFAKVKLKEKYFFLSKTATHVQSLKKKFDETNLFVIHF